MQQIQQSRELSQRQQARLSEIVSDCAALPDADLPPLWAQQKIGSDSPAHFRDVMCSTFWDLGTRFRLHPGSRILDLGCGCGRLTFPMSRLVGSTGRYYGADVWKEGIEICAGLFPQVTVTFHWLDAANNYYFDPLKPGVANDFRLDFCKTGSIDLAFAISVFTHLVEADVQSYLNEVRRILDPQGCAYVTCFIIDRFFHDFVRQTGQHVAVSEVAEGQYHAYEGQDFFAGYTLSRWQDMVRLADLGRVAVIAIQIPFRSRL